MVQSMEVVFAPDYPEGVTEKAEFKHTPITLTAEQREAFARTGEQALRVVTFEYGSGFPHFSIPGRTPLRNHTRHHTMGVRRDTLILLDSMGCTREEKAIGDAAASSHDVIQGEGAGVNEVRSAEWIEEKLVQEGVPLSLISVAQLAIMGTDILRDASYQPVFDPSGNVIQMATHQEYPSVSARRIALSVASADFGELHKPSSGRVAQELYREIKGYNADVLPPIDDELVRFQEGQVRLMHGYQAPLAEAEELLATHRAEVIAYNELALRRLQAGEIESWEQFVELAEQLMHQPETFASKVL